MLLQKVDNLILFMLFFYTLDSSSMVLLLMLINGTDDFIVFIWLAPTVYVSS